MHGPYLREQLENWVGDFCASDAFRDHPAGVREYASEILVKFMIAACEARQLDPGDLEESDLKTALLGSVAKLNIPAGVRTKVPALCAGFLAYLETEGRVSGGRVLGAFVRALTGTFEEAASGKAKPIVRPGSRLGRNDPCPCGSGKKYKKCCLNE